MSTESLYGLAWDVPETFDATMPDREVTRAPTWWWTRWLIEPERPSRSAPEPQRQAKEVLDWTGLSNRGLADALGTSHPTVGRLVTGQSTELLRRPEIRRRLADVHALCERLAPLVAHDSNRLLALLDSSDSDGTRLLDLAARGQAARAYLIALGVLAPPVKAQFPASIYPSLAGEATASLHD